uniref:uncharacterized protein isoform X2 n=1 Tax=Semicossyphus pulcher TaxID=241346 RepID=UPI0037E71CD2
MKNTKSLSDMHYYLLSVVCLLHSGLCAEECKQAVLARRETFHVLSGGSLSLSCVVKHCGHTWMGDWMWRNSTQEKAAVNAIKEGVRHRLSNMTLSANETRLILYISSVKQSDGGSYGCCVKWVQGETDQGHWTYVNVTAAVPSQRSVLHRIFVCAGASLCLPIILGLANFMSSEVKPQPLPRTLSTHAAVSRNPTHSTPRPPPRCSQIQKGNPVPQKCGSSSQRAPPKPQWKTEVVYADISQDVPRQQGATREPAQSTVYSSLKFQNVNKAE